MLLKGRAGPSASYQKRKAAIEQVEAQAKAAGATKRRAAGDAERVSLKNLLILPLLNLFNLQAIGNVKDQVGALSTEAKKKERQERQNSGWKSDAFSL